MSITRLNFMRLIPMLLASALPFAAHAAPASAAIHKLGKRLAVIVAAVQEHRTQPLMAAALTRELFRQNSPLEARWNAAGQVQVYLHYDRNGSPPDSAELAALGATGILNSPALGVVQAWIPADQLENASTLSGVARVTVPRYAFTRRSPTITALPRTGSVDTQGDQILGAAQFRSQTGYTGQGMVVGVISDGDSGVSTDQGTGDLPSNIWNDPNNTTWKSSGAEGTAMMEIVYDLAPGVKRLGFAGPATTADFLTALNDFSSTINANVIVDDLGFPGEAMFTNGDFANGVQQFASAHPNIHLVTAAGNDGSAFWAGQWVPYALVSTLTVNNVQYNTALDFGSSNPELTFQVQPGDTAFYIVEWDDPWNDTATTNDPNGDYDAVLFDQSGTALACNQGMNVSTTNGKCNQANSLPLNTPGPQPIQGNQWQNTGSVGATVHLEIFLVSGTPGTSAGDLGNQFKIIIGSQMSNVIQITPNTSAGSIFGQSAVGVPVGSTLIPGEITVGAVTPNTGYMIEPYSSLGPVQFGIVGTGTFPTETIQEPSFVAPDCVSVTGVGGFGSPFCGTSAAAPHIAGLLALLIPAYPNADPYTLLQDSASQPGGGLNPNGVYGFGLPNLATLLTSGTYPATSAVITSPASGTNITGGQSTTFAGECLGYDGTGRFTYNWNFGTSAIADSSAQSPSVTYNNAGTYTVTLTCANTAGSGSATTSVTVSAPRFGGGGNLGLLSLAALALLQWLSVIHRRPPHGI